MYHQVLHAPFFPRTAWRAVVNEHGANLEDAMNGVLESLGVIEPKIDKYDVIIPDHEVRIASLELLSGTGDTYNALLNRVTNVEEDTTALKKQVANLEGDVTINTAAVNSIADKIGNLANLNTKHKETLVDAINDAAATGGTGGSSVDVDDALDATSDNPVANKAIVEAIEAVNSAIETMIGGPTALPITIEYPSPVDPTQKATTVINNGVLSLPSMEGAKAVKVDPTLAPVDTETTFSAVGGVITIPAGISKIAIDPDSTAAVSSIDGDTVKLPFSWWVNGAKLTKDDGTFTELVTENEYSVGKSSLLFPQATATSPSTVQLVNAVADLNDDLKTKAAVTANLVKEFVEAIAGPSITVTAPVIAADGTVTTPTSLSVATGDEDKLVLASDIADITSYTDNKLKELNLTETGGTDKIITTVKQENGVVTATAQDAVKKETPAAANAREYTIAGCSTKVEIPVAVVDTSETPNKDKYGAVVLDDKGADLKTCYVNHADLYPTGTKSFDATDNTQKTDDAVMMTGKAIMSTFKTIVERIENIEAILDKITEIINN